MTNYFSTRKFLALFLALVMTFSLFGQPVVPVKATDTFIEFEGFQISTLNQGYRSVYSVIDPDSTILSSGIIYGLGRSTSLSDMTLDSTNQYVHAYDSTSKGLLPISVSDYPDSRSYAMTMRFADTAEYYNSSMRVRAYARTSEGSVIYSDVCTFSVFDLADTLYKNCQMSSEEGHSYLYNNILTRVNPDYIPVSYDWNSSIVDPGKTTENPVTTEAITTQPATTEPVTTEAVTTQPATTEAVTTQPVTQPETTTAFDEDSLEVPDAPNATGAPNKSQFSIDTWSSTESYTFNATIWYGMNATRYILYEKKGLAGTYSVISTGTLTDDSPNKQEILVTIPAKKFAGTYYYKMVLKNKVNGTVNTTVLDELSYAVGGSESSSIILDQIDNDDVAIQHVISQGTYTYDIDFTESDNYSFSVVSSNTSAVKASIVNGKQLQLQAVGGGRSGIKITESVSGAIRQFGVRVKEADDTLSPLPNYLALGQVSEDSDGDLAFWDATSDDDTNKRVDVRYIYINGGPLENGWQSWNPSDPGKRVKTYIKESLKRGIVPYFVYYNIPDSDENYSLDLQHINDTTYMEAYYKDLVFFLETCDAYDNGDTVGIILEPDFIGYMMQNSGKSPSEITASGVSAVYSSGVLTQGVDPDFPNTLEGIVKSINYIISTKYPTAQFGWQFNTWSYSNGVPGAGLMHATETMGFESGRAFIKNAAIETANYYMSAGILSYGADFISIDKYGLDGAYESGASANPASSKWLWNSDLWSNYLYYTKTLHETTNKPVTLWQLPVGHLNTSQTISPYTGSLFQDLTNATQNYEDSAPTYFFGDTFIPGTSERLNYFGLNAYGDSKVTVSGNTVTYGSHMQEAVDAGVTLILFGAGVGASTDCVGDPPGDSYWWITKAQQYYKNPVELK